MAARCMGSRSCCLVDVVARRDTNGRALKGNTTSLGRIVYQNIAVRHPDHQLSNGRRQYWSSPNTTAMMAKRKESFLLSSTEQLHVSLRKASSSTLPKTPSTPTLPPRQVSKKARAGTTTSSESSEPAIDVPIITLSANKYGYRKPKPPYETLDNGTLRSYHGIFKGFPANDKRLPRTYREVMSTVIMLIKSHSREDRKEWLGFAGAILVLATLFVIFQLVVYVTDRIEWDWHGVRWVEPKPIPVRTNAKRGELPTPTDPETMSDQSDAEEEFQRCIKAAADALRVTEAAVPLGSLDELLNLNQSDGVAAAAGVELDGIGADTGKPQALDDSSQKPWYRFW